jgi:two-component system cell cycle sensor histidine kinase/response regulator CckA
VRILVIDDEEMIRDLAQRILTQAGFDVLIAESGQSGLKLFSEKFYLIDLVLLDLTMDDMPGIETLERIREISPDLPCIISSGQEPGANELPDKLNQNVCFLQKPYRAKQLLEMVNQISSPIDGSLLRSSQG